MAGKVTKKGAKRSPKQKAAARRNIKKAQAAAKRKRLGGAPMGGNGGAMFGRPKKKRTAKQKAAARKNIKKAQKAAHGGKRRKSRKGSKRRRTGGSTRSTSRVVKSTLIKHLPGHTTQLIVSPLTGGSRRKRKSGGKKRRKGSKGKRKSGRKGKKKKGGRKAREGYAMENPMGAMEIAVGVLTGVLGYGVMDFLDRFIATHSLTDKGSKDASGSELYADNPPSASTTSFLNKGYGGLFNATAVLAPMNLPRWGAGLLLPAVAIGSAAFIKSPAGRSAVQMFGFGAAMKTAGKALTDLVSMVTKKTSVGQRLYDGEARAAALKVGDGSEASLPSAGLGKPAKQMGVGGCCGGCASGGKCTKTLTTTNAAPPPPPPPPPPPAQNLTGPIDKVLTPPGTGAPVSSIEPKKNKYNWGNENAA
jgi:hypothetical protein